MRIELAFFLGFWFLFGSSQAGGVAQLVRAQACHA